VSERIDRHTDLIVYRRAFEAAMRIFELSKTFPREKTYSLTDQVRRSARSVSTNIAEAWGKRRYEAAFISKLNDSETEARETQSWIEHGVRCSYIERSNAAELYHEYDEIIAMLVDMMTHADKWTLP
jgi:four helix bundle protein